MINNILKIITNFKKDRDLDAKFWIQKILLQKSLKNNPFLIKNNIL
tara:strand:- start:67 stop:204 length:138 start_codon:yes stop_codon:yes gene_type:complete